MGPYPTEAELRKISKWGSDAWWADLMEYVEGLWDASGVGCYTRNGRTWTLHTGGWSGCEDILVALQKNFLFWSMCWVSSRRGGHVVLRLPKGSMPRRVKGAPCE